MLFLRGILCILLVICGIAAVRIEFAVLDVGILAVLFDLPFIILSLVTIVTLFIDTKIFSITRKWYHFLPSIAGLIFIGIIMPGKISRYVINTSPAVMYMTGVPGKFPFFNLELKENGNFKLYEPDLFGESIYYGEYRKVGDSIYLDRYNYEKNTLLPRRGFLLGDTITWNDSIMMTHKAK